MNRDPVALGERITERIGPDGEVLNPVPLFYTVTCGDVEGP